SGDDRAPKILGYSDKGSFDSENLPPQLKAMMESWTKQIVTLPENAGRHISWSKSHSTRSGNPIHMETAEWGQGYPFNAYCPVIDGVQAPAGCVATAMAIVMKYHNWPDYTRGGEESDFYHPELNFNFSDYTIDWKSLSDNESSEFGQASARLSLAAGVSASMFYSPEESSADVWTVGHSLMQYFVYDKDCQYIERKIFTDEEWIKLLLSQLEEIGPVIYRGSGSIGHAFVIDGYDGESLFHVNWGWDGLLNGYYALDFEDVAGANFSGDQGMIINIKPDKERREYSKLWISNVDTYLWDVYGQKDWNFSTPDIIPGESVSYVKFPAFTENKFIGFFRIAVVDSNDKIVSFVGDKYGVNTYYGTSCAYPGFTDWLTDVVFPLLKDGERYQLVSQEVKSSVIGQLDERSPSNNPSDYRLVLGGIRYPSYFTDKGNRSDYGEVIFHVEDPLPIYFSEFNTWEREFSIKHLCGVNCWSNFCGPQKEYLVDAQAFDEKGEEVPGEFVNGDNSGALGNYTISVFSPRLDVYIRPDRSAGTRRDQKLSEEDILEVDGLVYKISGNEATLIGYDTVGENLIIPDVVEKDNDTYAVTAIGSKALLYAPSKTLTIKCNHLKRIGDYAFAAMNDLEYISIDGIMKDENLKMGLFPLLKSSYQDIYCTQLMPYCFLPNALSMNMVIFRTDTPVYHENVNCWVSALPENREYYLPIGQQRSYEAEWEEMLGSYNVPGLGGTTLFTETEDYGMKEMWKYSIDAVDGWIKINEVIPNVVIDRVEINGNEVESEEDELYRIPEVGSEADGLDVKVDYTVNSTMKMTTHYTSEYNKTVIEANSSYNPDSVDECSFEVYDSIDVFSLDGILISCNSDKDYLNSLTPGIYIIRQGNRMKKLVIR
ncbi:MAG: C10 family peptidase, partial [Muribaculaceae bacterium]|nr:C10 family peptidase [Muribaculaceae bacterium]